MNHLLDTDIEDDAHARTGDREISLGPGTILGLFFGLAIVCGAFFGLGYSMGRHSAQNSASPMIVSSASPAVSSTTKPTAGSVAAAFKPTAEAAEVSRNDSPAPPAKETKTTPADAAIAGDRIPARPAAATATAAPAPASPGALPQIAPNGTFMVQVAAVSSKDIADIELAALRKFNYQVVVRHEPTDQLLHIQIGPFATKKDAEAMRQNVLSHGFNAIVK